MNPFRTSFHLAGSTQGLIQRLAARRLTTHQNVDLVQPCSYLVPGRTSPTFHPSNIRSFVRVIIHRSAQPKRTSLLRQNYSTNTKLDPTSQTANLSVSQRFRKLSREYGWTAMGVYLALSALDFPFCFAAVRWLGPDRVGRAEKAVVEKVQNLIPEQIKYRWRQAKAKIKGLRPRPGSGSEIESSNTIMIGEVIDDYDHGVLDAEARTKGANASIWTQLALAYAIHKSFIFIRLPITVAILPKVVKTLRGWGWQIGKRKPKGVQAL